MLCVLLSLFGSKSVLKDARTVFNGFKSESVTLIVFFVVNTIDRDVMLSPDCN